MSSVIYYFSASNRKARKAQALAYRDNLWGKAPEDTYLTEGSGWYMTADDDAVVRRYQADAASSEAAGSARSSAAADETAAVGATVTCEGSTASTATSAETTVSETRRGGPSATNDENNCKTLLFFS